METASTSGAFWEKHGTAIAVLLGAVIIGGAFVYGQGGTPREPAVAGAVDIKEVSLESGPSVGDADAPVVMAVWYDYQCPFCKQFELDTVAKLYAEYVQAGKLRILIKDFQFLGPDSATAALFGRAVWEAYPERFYEWYVAMAENQDEEHGGFGDLATIQAMTRGLGGMDVDRITRLTEDNRATYQAAIEADRAEGAKFGISGTPSMIVGTTVLSGAQPYERVKALVDEQLAK
jgi:protein-disulfide isomerase